MIRGGGADGSIIAFNATELTFPANDVLDDVCSTCRCRQSCPMSRRTPYPIPYGTPPAEGTISQLPRSGTIQHYYSDLRAHGFRRILGEGGRRPPFVSLHSMPEQTPLTLPSLILESSSDRVLMFY